jgi:alpha-D-xyloside xylohydrolase
MGDGRTVLYKNDDGQGAALDMVPSRSIHLSGLVVYPFLPSGEVDIPSAALSGRQKWIDYQTGKVYAPGWNNIECGTLPIIILVKDGSAIPHIPVAQCTDQMKWDKITWKKYLADEKKAEGLLCLPQDGQLQRISIP